MPPVTKLIHPCYKWHTLKKRPSFQTSKVEEAHGMLIVIIQILLIISSTVNRMNKKSTFDNDLVRIFIINATPP